MADFALDCDPAAFPPKEIEGRGLASLRSLNPAILCYNSIVVRVKSYQFEEYGLGLAFSSRLTQRSQTANAKSIAT